LSQELAHNYLDLERLEKFSQAIPKLDCYTKGFQRPALRSSELILFYKILFYCALRVSEGLRLTKEDFNLQSRVLYIKNAKTGKGKTQKTTIAPPLLEDLKWFLNSRKDGEILFPMCRDTALRYAKEAGYKAELNIIDELEQKTIHGIYTHIFRKSYAKFMENKGANPSYIMIKGRWKPSAMYQVYTKPSIMALVEWEDKIFENL